tara:strand:- start:2644 stop:3063 length:420 start_codon:yes stop_codon:yes gene_type:complete
MPTTAKAKPSFAKGKSVADYLNAQIDMCGKSQKEIADELGYTKPNIITMFKQGITKVPVHRAPAIAKAIGVNESKFLRMVMAEYMPEALEAVERHMSGLLVESEREILSVYREAVGSVEIKVTKAHKSALKKACKSIFV